MDLKGSNEPSKFILVQKGSFFHNFYDNSNFISFENVYCSFFHNFFSQLDPSMANEIKKKNMEKLDGFEIDQNINFGPLTL